MALYGQCYPDRHNTSPDESWLSCQTKESPNPVRGASHWILYDFGETYELGQSHFWNLNVPEGTSSGISTAVIDYSIDGITWSEFGSFTMNEANASGFYEGEDGPDLGGIIAQFVLVTILENHGGQCFGFSEMRIATTGVMVSTDDLAQHINEMFGSPNPATENAIVNINSKTVGPAQINLIDINGKTVSQKLIALNKGTNKFDLDISPYPAGQYLVNLEIDGKIKSTKLSIINK